MSCMRKIITLTTKKYTFMIFWVMYHEFVYNRIKEMREFYMKKIIEIMEETVEKAAINASTIRREISYGLFFSEVEKPTILINELREQELNKSYE